MRRPKTYVIDEDEHLENLRKIIKRDFFSNKDEPQDESLPMRLNDYIKHFKSEENQVFSELVQSEAEDWKKKHEWMQKSQQLMLQSDTRDRRFANMICKDPNINKIDFSIVNQDSQNAVFFKPNVQNKSYNEAGHDEAKKIYYENCRIDVQQAQRNNIKKAYSRNPNFEEIPATPILAGRESTKKFKPIDPEQQYSMKRMPSPEPQKLPIMTWGEVESTPMRIAPENEVQYRMPQQSVREKILQELTSKLTKQKMIKKNKKEDLKLKILSSVRPAQSSYRKPSIGRESSIKREESRIYGIYNKK